MTILLTGATGFLGMEFVARAVQADTADVVCVIRADDDAHAARRLHDTLTTLYGDDVPAAADDRLIAVAGNLEQPGLGLGPAAASLVADRVTRIVHGAASIRFDLPLDEARAVNVDGTAHVLGVARALHAAGRLRRYVHVSTAYVAGRHAGDVHESGSPVTGAPRNTYEQTKREAEVLVREAAAAGLPAVIARPSIVVGDSQTGWTPAFNVLYWPLRALSRGMLGATVPADPDGLVDVVPVDFVADAIAYLTVTDEPVSGTYHLTAGPAATQIGELMDMGCAAFGCDRPAVAPPIAAGDVDGSGHEAGVFIPYFDVLSHFDATRARALLEPAGITCPPLADYFDRIVGYAVAARWGKTGCTRAAAGVQPDAVSAI
ncbi:Linear gramicidin synthase subunit D [Paraconexibacter sp. AEG42_29]|uniref:Linear gramicidin synthase subunit D n=1 Tax=Paraconexibacter sp. AEG42_29 TaxID=2997339 RepID=A0AAU7B020_9ACTN